MPSFINSSPLHDGRVQLLKIPRIQSAAVLTSLPSNESIGEHKLKCSESGNEVLCQASVSAPTSASPSIRTKVGVSEGRKNSGEVLIHAEASSANRKTWLQKADQAHQPLMP